MASYTFPVVFGPVPPACGLTVRSTPGQADPFDDQPHTRGSFEPPALTAVSAFDDLPDREDGDLPAGLDWHIAEDSFHVPVMSVAVPLKAKEVDSGITSLETPFSDDDAGDSSPPDSPLSTASAPASAPSSLPSGSVASASSIGTPPGPSTPVRSASLPAITDLTALYFAFETAQRTFHAKAAIFVGNLPANNTDLELANRVYAKFREFGRLTLQIKRTYDKHAVKPYALIQYENADAAHLAVRAGNCMVMGDRRLRADMSTAKRTLYLVHWDYARPCTWQELEYVFGQFGIIESIVWDYQRWGWAVKFECYGSYQAAAKALQEWGSDYRRV